MRRTLALPLLCALAGCARAPQPEAPRGAIVYPPPPDLPRVQHLASIATIDDLPRRRSGFADFVLGAEESRPGVIKPYGVAMHGARLYACDTILNNVVVFDFATGRVSSLSSNLGAEQLQNPINLAVAPDGTVYVADAGRGQIVVFGPDGRHVTSLGAQGQATPGDVCLDGDRLIVADLEGNQVEVWDRTTGQVIDVWGRLGGDDGEFNTPTNLAVAPDGTICVSDTMNFRVQRLSPEGRPLGAFGDVGTGFGDFARPKGIAVDAEGRVYVADARFNNVQIFNPEGQLLMFFGGLGEDPSNMDLPADVALVTDPASIALFADRVIPGQRLAHLILVSSQFGRPEIDVYGFFAGETPPDAAPGPR